MNQLIQLWRRLLFYVRGDQLNRELEEEMRFHLEMKAAENLARGMPLEEARFAAQRQFGNQTLLREVSLDMWAFRSLEAFVQDLSYGLRMMVKTPGFTAVTVMTLALGVGTNTALFSMIDAVLLKTLPVERPEQLFFISHAGTQGQGAAPPYACFERFRNHTSYLSGIAAFSPSELKVSIDGQIEQVRAQLVSGNYFSVLGVPVVLGRPLTPSDDSVIGAGGPAGGVAVIGYDYWRRRFGLDPEVIGKVILIGKIPATIIGVTPPKFFGLSPGRDVDINLPLMLADPRLLADKGSGWFYAFGRLKPESSVAQARAELDAIFQGFMDEIAISHDVRKNFFDHIEFTAAGKGLDTLRIPYSKALLTLMVMVGLVLLIVCANVANLLLVRATARRKEFAMRLALGASRVRLVRQMFTESLLLVSLGGLFGLALARWSIALLIRFFSIGRSQMSLDLPLDSRLLFFTLGLSMLTGIAFSVAPAWRSARLDPGPTLKESTVTASADPSRLRLGKLLLVAQVALALVLLVGAGLFLRSLQNLKNLDAGFRSDGVLTLRIDSGARDYQVTQLNRLWQETLALVEAVPGVSSASLSTMTPLDGLDASAIIDLPGFTSNTERDKSLSINHVSPEYFTTLGIAILRGRPFNERDNESSLKVALLNETATRFYFGDRDPIGTKIRLTHPRTADPYEVVGVVADSRQVSLRQEIPRQLYLPTSQSLGRLARLTLAARTSDDPSRLADPIRNVIRSMGSDILVTNVVSLSEQVNQSLLQERLVSSLSGVFGLLALLLSCIGLYGVTSYNVMRRTQEIGIRLALGAKRSDVLRMLLWEGFVRIASGLALGLIASLAATRILVSLLYGVSATDPETFVGVSLLLTGVALVACYLPARRATKVDPIVALRCE